MISNEKKDISLMLRDNRVQRQQLAKLRDALSADTARLLEERKSLIARAEKLGMKIGKISSVTDS